MERQDRIGNVSAGLMIVSALLIDAIQALLTFSVVLLPFSLFFTFTALAGFGIWFMLHGVKYTENGGKKLLTAIAAGIAELAPFINALPAVTAGVLGIIVQTRIEDRRANAGKTVTPRTAMAAVRLRKMSDARAQRADSARESREEAQSVRHAAGNDNEGQQDMSEAA